MNIKELAEKHYVCIEFERGDVHACYEFSITELEQFAELVAAHEREECAEIAESKRHAPHFVLTSMPSQNGTAVDIANLIKARGQA